MEKIIKEKSITLSNLALKHLIEELQILKNGFINNVQTTSEGLLKMKIHTKEGDKNLLILPNYLFISEKSIPAKQNPGGFSALLKKYLNNQRIITLTQKDLDRVIIFEFPEKLLIVELFAKGNIILCEKNYKIIKAMKKEEWKDRKLEKDEIYKFPSSKGINPLEETPENFYKKLKENKKTLFGATLDELNIFPTLLEKVFLELKIEKTTNSNEVDEKTSKKLLEKIKEKYGSNAIKPYTNQNIIYTIELGLEKEKEFENLNKTLNETTFNKEETSLVKETLIKKENKKERTQIILDNIAKKEIEEKEMKQKGDTIYLHYSEINELIETIKKGEKKGLNNKEIMEKINSIKPSILLLDLEKKQLKLRL